MESYAKLCFNCNELPRDIEQTDAYFRRLLIIPFKVTIPEAEQDKELAQKIVRAELPGVLNWVLAGLTRLLANKRFTASETVDATIEEYRRDSDSVASYLDDQGEGNHLNGLLKELFADYVQWARDANLKPLGRTNFSKRLQIHGYIVERKGPGMMVCCEEVQK